MTELISNAIYHIVLCSGEFRRWRYLGSDTRLQVWWRGIETVQEFSESSLMYAWQIVPEEDVPPSE